MSTKGDQFLCLSCQRGGSHLCLPASYATGYSSDKFWAITSKSKNFNFLKSKFMLEAQQQQHSLDKTNESCDSVETKQRSSGIVLDACKVKKKVVAKIEAQDAEGWILFQSRLTS